MKAEVPNPREALSKETRAALRRQRDGFQRYLRILDQQRRALEGREVARYRAHAELEAAAVREIAALAKVIGSLRRLGRVNDARADARADAEPGTGPDPEALALGEEVEELRRQALEGNLENRRIIDRRMEAVRAEMVSLRRNIRARSPFSDIGVPTRVDLRT